MPPLLVDLSPIAQLRAGRLARRLPQLLVGLWLYGASLALMVRGDLGLAPWDVLHSGLIRHLPVTLGQMVIIASIVVLLLWIPLREKPGIGTVANALLVGISADVTLSLLDRPDDMAARVSLMLLGVFLNGVATALYIGSQFGRGPRDGLMTGLVRRTGWRIAPVRTGIELSVVVLGVALGGALGVGTVLYAFALGPLTQWMLPVFVVPLVLDVRTPELDP
ncbi:membrane protein YczE [Nocardioides alcanivorans]|uniref:membrane protein YczE n=1 Tax=Nocardioides alcanivorans TaxID=2897352 RepID=UPI001F36824F|nr:hypothetical protein [Nocardioides alcanivorans]